ncbi:MAG: glutamate racemase [Leptospirales bacterium]
MDRRSWISGDNLDLPLLRGGVALFDSGIGGMTVLRHFLDRFPEIPFAYLGDTARFPYGTKSRETILRFAREDVLFLKELEPALIVAACFTVSSQVFPDLAEECQPLPVVGVLEPGARAACRVTKTGSIGVLATEGTIRSGAYPAMIRSLKGGDVRVVGQPCPLFAPLVEEGVINDPIAKLVALRYLEPFLIQHKDVDTIILGCTHYPPLRAVLESILPGVTFIDPGFELARELEESGRLKNLERAGDPVRRFYVTDSPERFIRIGQNLLGQRIDEVPQVLTLPDPIETERSGKNVQESIVREDGRFDARDATELPERMGMMGL